MFEKLSQLNSLNTNLPTGARISGSATAVLPAGAGEGLADPLQSDRLIGSSSTLTATLNPSVVSNLVLDPAIFVPLDGAGNTMATARNLGNLNSLVSASDFVGSYDAVDYYAFTVGGFGSSNFNLSLTGMAAGADLDVSLYSSTGAYIAGSSRGSNLDESINLESLAVGQYYLRVTPFSGGSGYTLRLSNTDPSNLLPTETNVGTLSSYATYSDSIGSNDTADVYRFSLSSIREVTFALTGLSQDADLRLIQDANSNGVVDAGDVLVSSTRGSSLNETFSKVLLTGNYFAQVTQFSGNTDYQLRLSAAAPQVRVNLTNVHALNNPDSGIFWDDADFYSKITIDGTTWTSGVISNDNTIAPNWQFSRTVNSRYVPITIEVWDSDGGLAGADDFIDLDPRSGFRQINLTYDVFTNTVSGDVSGIGGQLLTSIGGGGDGDRAQAWFRVETADWYARNLGDTHLTNLTRSFAADGSLNRTDMISLLREAKDYGSVDATELTDLRKIVSDLGYMMPTHVRNLSNKVVNSDPANPRSGIGNLFAGASDLHMERLVGKWFLGTDRPDAPGTTYRQVSGSLFRNGISYLDVDQNAAADCYFLSSLGAVAFRSPSTIQNMFINNGDGTYTVRFFNNGVADYVTVDTYLPTSAGGNAVFGGWGGGRYDSSTNELWMALAEKAYAQINESGWIGQDNTNTYAGIDFGWHEPTLEQITGLNANDYSMTAAGSVNNLISAFNANKMISLCTYNSTSSGIVGNHCYTMIGYNSTTDQFRVYNPWGYDNDAQAERWISRAQLLANFSNWAAA